MTITRSGNVITVSSAFTQGSPTSWEAIFQADVAGGWGQITKLGTSAYRMNGGSIFFDGWIAGDNIFVEFANGAIPLYRNSGGCRFGQWNATTQTASAGCTFLFSARTTNFNDSAPAFFNGSANCSFNGCKIILDLDPTIGTPTTDSRRMDFSVTPGDGWGSATIPSSTTVLNLRGCDFLVQSGFCVTHLYQNSSSEVINTQFFAGSKGLHFFERLSGGTFSGLRLASNIVSGFSASTTPFVFDRFVFLTTAQSVLRSGRHDVLDPTFTGGQTKLVVTTTTQRPFTANSRARQQYRYSLRVNAFLGGGINDARLAIFDSTSSQVAYLASESGVFATQNITRWQWVRQSDTVAAESSLGPHTYVLGKYGRQRISYSYDNQSTQPISETKELQAVVVALTEVQAAAVNWVTVNHGSSLITVSGSNRSMSDIHDYLQWLCVQDGQMQFPVLATKQGTTITTPYNWSLAASFTGNFTLEIAANRTLTLTQAGTYGFSATIPATGTLVVPGDGAAVSVLNIEFAAGATINRSGSGTATVTVAAGQAANITAGTGVVIQEPPTLFTATNLTSATFNNVRCRVSLVPGGSVAIDATTGARVSGGVNFLTSDVNTSANTITLAGINGKLNANTVIRFYGTDLPVPLDPRAVYYPSGSYTTGNALSVSNTPGGAAIDLIDVGSGSDMYADLWTQLNMQVVTSGAYTFDLNAAALAAGVTLANNDVLVLQAVHWNGATVGNPAIASEYLETSFQYTGTSITTLVGLELATLHNQFCVLRNTDGSQVTAFVLDPSAPGKVQIDTAVTGFRSDEAALFFYYIRSTATGLRLLRDNIQLRGINEIRVVGQLTIDAANRAICSGPYIYRADGGFITAIESAQIEYRFENPVGVVSTVQVPVQLSEDVLTTLAATLAQTSTQVEQIEASTILAKETTAQSAVSAARTAAQIAAAGL